MTSCSNNQTLERAQPWLGTLVSISVAGLPQEALVAATDAAFQQIARVHRLMSFFDRSSDVSRLNTARDKSSVQVHPLTYRVLECALRLSSLTAGCFDVAVGTELVRWNQLPAADTLADADGRWQDIELLSDSFVRLHRPVCVDLGGIAKGFAVDLATAALQAHGASRTVVNAGGDIRVCGAGAEWIALSATAAAEGTVPMLALENGSVASSCGQPRARRHQGKTVGPHVDGVYGTPVRTDRFVSVVAQECMVADALTKVVLAQGHACEHVLMQFGAEAYLQDAGGHWQTIATGQQLAAA